MKTTTKFSLAATGLAFMATAAVFADDPQLPNRLDLQRNQAPSGRQTSTVAVYTGPRSQKETTVTFSRHGMPLGRTGNTERERWMDVSTPQGGTINYFAPAQ